jgi:hypothetical protein
MLRARMAIAAAGVLLLAAACSKDSTGVSTDVTGTWNGSATQTGVTFSFTMQVSESSGGQLTGSGTASGAISGGSSLMFDVSGTRTGSNVTMSLNVSGFISPVFTGRLVDANTVSGKLDGSGFDQLPLTLRR